MIVCPWKEIGRYEAVIPGLADAVKAINALTDFTPGAYPLPGGKTVQFLDDGSAYLGNQLECTFGGTRCFGIAAGLQFILICTYEANGANPELVLYKQR